MEIGAQRRVLSSSHQAQRADSHLGMEQGTRAAWQGALGSQRSSSTGIAYPDSEYKTCSKSSFTYRQRSGCAPRGTFVVPGHLPQSFQRCLEGTWKMFSLLRLAGPCKFSSVPKGDTESRRPHQGAPNVTFSFQPFPSQPAESLALWPETSPLPAQAAKPQTCTNDHILYPRNWTSSVPLSTWKTAPEHVLLMIRNILISVCTHSWPPQTY